MVHNSGHKLRVHVDKRNRCRDAEDAHVARLPQHRVERGQKVRAFAGVFSQAAGILERHGGGHACHDIRTALVAAAGRRRLLQQIVQHLRQGDGALHAALADGGGQALLEQPLGVGVGVIDEFRECSVILKVLGKTGSRRYLRANKRGAVLWREARKPHGEVAGGWVHRLHAVVIARVHGRDQHDVVWQQGTAKRAVQP